MVLRHAVLLCGGTAEHCRVETDNNRGGVCTYCKVGEGQERVGEMDRREIYTDRGRGMR